MVISLSLSARTHSVDEFLIDDKFQAKGSKRIILKHSYQINEVENDNDSSISDIEYDNRETTLAGEYQLTENSQLRFIFGYTAHFKGISQNSLFNDPYIIYWKRIKKSGNHMDITGDFGFELSPSLSTGNLYKNKNGHQAIFKYRFGVGDDDQRVHATYFLGYKDGVRFTQDSLKRKYKSALLWGASLSANYRLYKNLFSGANISTSHKSQNQAEVFFSNVGSGSSWENVASILLYLKLSKQQTLSLSYRFQNESSSFNKLGKSLDIEGEQKRLSLSFERRF